MIKFVREYKTGYSDEIKYDVIHETNGKQRWFFYSCYFDLPKTAKKFIEKSAEHFPYKDDFYKEYGTVYR